jgi:hypothetical protein
MKTRNMETRDLDEVITIHLNFYPTFFFGATGNRMVTLYYAEAGSFIVNDIFMSNITQ